MLEGNLASPTDSKSVHDYEPDAMPSRQRVRRSSCHVPASIHATNCEYRGSGDIRFWRVFGSERRASRPIVAIGIRDPDGIRPAIRRVRWEVK